MAKVITTELQHSGASGANITLDSSKNVTCENNLTVDGTTTLTGAVTLPAGTTSDTLSFRNLVINGAMQVAQRMNGSNTGGLNLDGVKTVDRFALYTGGTDNACTQHHVDVAAGTTPYTLGFRKKYQITNGNQTGGAGAADYAFIRYSIEAQDLANSGWNYKSASSYITLSFWVKASVAQTYYTNITSKDGTTQSYPFSYALSADTWTKVTKTIPGLANGNIDVNNDNGSGLGIDIWPFAGTDYTASGVTLEAWAAYSTSARFADMTSTWWTTNDATFEITGVQLEVGDTATDFEHRSYAEELLRCQRYYHNYKGDASDGIGIPGTAWGTGSFTFFVHHPVTMRANPSIEGAGTCRFQSSNDSAAFDCSDFTIQNAPTDFKSMTINKSGSSGGTVHAAGSIQLQSANSILAFNAEL